MSVNEQRLLDSWTSERDADAFKAIANRYAGLVYTDVRRILGNDTDAEDVAQECFLALAGAGRNPGGFLGAMAAPCGDEQVADADSRRAEPPKSREVWQPADMDPVAAATHRDLCAVVDEAIARLPDDLRVPLVAHFIEDKTHEVIAADLGVSRQTVTYRIGKGIERIRKRLQVKRGRVFDGEPGGTAKTDFSSAGIAADRTQQTGVGGSHRAGGRRDGVYRRQGCGGWPFAVVCVGGWRRFILFTPTIGPRPIPAWHDIAQTATSTPVQAKRTLSPAQPEAAPQEPGKFADSPNGVFRQRYAVFSGQ